MKTPEAVWEGKGQLKRALAWMTIRHQANQTIPSKKELDAEQTFYTEMTITIVVHRRAVRGGSPIPRAELYARVCVWLAWSGVFELSYLHTNTPL